MLKRLLFLIIPLLALVTSACEGGPPAVPSTPFGIQGPISWPPHSQQTGLSVNGEGRVSFSPDIAILSLGIEAQEKTVAAAQDRARGAMSNVLAALKAKGVADKDIRTRFFSIQPVRQTLPPPRPDITPTPREVIVGYRVTNTVSAKIGKLDNVGPIIDEVAEVGGDLTRINSISFTIDDATPWRRQAREKAMQDAMDKAKQMASLAGVGLGKPINISESGGYVPSPQEVRTFALGVAPAPAAPPTLISPGEMELTVTVHILFAIK